MNYWRHGLYEACLQNSPALAELLEKIKRYRKPRGVYTEVGGCMDTTQEFSRWACPGSSDIALPIR